MHPSSLGQTKPLLLRPGPRPGNVRLHPELPLVPVCFSGHVCTTTSCHRAGDAWVASWTGGSPATVRRPSEEPSDSLLSRPLGMQPSRPATCLRLETAVKCHQHGPGGDHETLCWGAKGSPQSQLGNCHWELWTSRPTPPTAAPKSPPRMRLS